MSFHYIKVVTHREDFPSGEETDEIAYYDIDLNVDSSNIQY
jgi:hypothetical protein